MNLAKLLNIYVQQWIRRRYSPFVRVGLRNLRDGLTAKSGLQAGTGAAMVAFGFLQKRSRQRTLLYAGNMSLGESMRVRVRRGGKVIDEFTVNG